MLAGIVAVIAAVLRVNGGFSGSMEALARVTDDGVSASPGVFASIFGPKPLDLLGVVLLTSVGTWGLPQMVQKFYSIKSEKNISTGTVVSTVFAVVISGGCYFLGGFGRLFDSPAMRNDAGAMIYDAVIPEMLSGFTPLLIGIVIVLVLAASISTLSSLVMASASTFTLDFLKGNFIKKMGDKTQLLVIRALVAVFIAVSAVIAVVQYKGGVSFIAQLMGVSWGALAGAFLAPFLYGLYWKRVTSAAVWVNFIFAALFMIANIFFRASFPAILQSPINAGAFTMLFGLILIPVVSLLTKKPDGALIEKCFECYNETVAVRAAESLGQTKEDA
jgi:SSS family solute:Na+ symporter